MPPETFPGLKISPKCVCSRAPPWTPLRAHSAPPDILAGLGQGLGREGRGEEGREGKGREGEMEELPN